MHKRRRRDQAIVAPRDRLDASWRALFLKYPDRFLVGTDTWVTSRWDGMPGILDGVRAWLRQLPPEVAEKISRGNGDRLFPPQELPAIPPPEPEG